MTLPTPSAAIESVQNPQGVLTPLTAAAIFLVVTIEPGREDDVRDVLANLSGLQRTVGFREQAEGLALVTGIGSDAWDRLFEGPRPADLHPFVELHGDRHHAVSTPGDLLFHIRAERADLCFELATLITDELGDAITVVDEVHGFRYFDARDLLGFVDGSENPTGAAADAAVTVGAEDPEFAGSSYVIVQKYLHDMSAWNAISVEEQERVIGRRKLSNLELADDVKPSNSHIALNVITDDDGEELEILRENMPFGSVGTKEFGTYFIGYASTPAVIERMLQNMFLGDPPGNYDRILDFSTAVSGSLYFVPTVEFLDDPPGQAAAESPADPGPEPAPADRGDGSLGVGSLKPSPSVQPVIQPER